ncbi:hypothetical protein HDF17_003428 [Granulicella arctica]|uniref:Uncharacterized protein n=1 Tax=Granulicella arctica TaxID=940613 RepID=A0A7Y9PL85_9BACT|nr:hypothetical protein [Granulicella arctica]
MRKSISPAWPASTQAVKRAADSLASLEAGATPAVSKPAAAARSSIRWRSSGVHAARVGAISR